MKKIIALILWSLAPGLAFAASAAFTYDPAPSGATAKQAADSLTFPAGKTLRIDGAILGNGFTKGAIGLGNVDNTSDAAKPISTAAQAALDLKLGIGAAASTYTPLTRTINGYPLSANVSLAKGDLGLGNVDNTSDASKPISDAAAAALLGKHPIKWRRYGTVLKATTVDDNGQVQEITVIREGNPQILNATIAPGGLVYKGFYSGGLAANMNYAESYDGVDWAKYSGNPILTGYTRAFVMRNGSQLWMYVLGSGGLNLFTSSNGVNWTLDTANLLTVGAPGAWDSNSIDNVCVLKESTNAWKMQFEANNALLYKEGLATSSDGRAWTKYGGNPTLSNAPGSVSSPWITKVGSTYYNFSHVSSTGFLPSDLALFSSPDMITWTRSPAGLILSRTTPDEGEGSAFGQLADPHLLEVDGRVMLWASTNNDGTNNTGRIGLFVADCTLAELVHSDHGAYALEPKKLIGGPDPLWESYQTMSFGSADGDATGKTIATILARQQTNPNGYNPSIVIGYDGVAASYGRNTQIALNVSSASSLPYALFTASGLNGVLINGKGLRVGGTSAVAAGNIAASGDITAGGGIAVTGGASVGADIAVTGAGSFGSNVAITGALHGILFNGGVPGSYSWYYSGVAPSYAMRLNLADDGANQRTFQIGYHTGNNQGSAWNTKFEVNGYTGDVSAAGVVSASLFVGSGANLVSIPTSALSTSADVQSLLGAANYAAMRTQLGLVIGTNVQAYDADLTTWASLTPSANAQSFVTAANYAAMKTLLSLNNVENTALSTWAGSTNLTTVGTIGAGTWQGSIVAPAYLGTGSSISTKFLRGDGTWQTIAGGGDALTSGTLAQFAATTSAQLAGVISNETGTNALVFSDSPTLNTATLNSPTLVTPALGSASATDLAIPGAMHGIFFNGGVIGSYSFYYSGVASSYAMRLNLADDGANQRTFQIGYHTGNNSASTWNTKFEVNGYTGDVSASGVVAASLFVGSGANLVSIPNAALNNSSVTIAGTTTSLGGSISLDTITGLSSTGIVKRTGANSLAIASSGTDYEVPLTFSTGLTRSTNTITVNTTQNIAKLSNLTSNGFVATSGGDGTLSVTSAAAFTSGTLSGLTGLAIRDTSAAFDVTIAATSSSALTAGRTLTLDVVNAARTVKLAGNLDFGTSFTTTGNTLTTNGVTYTLSGSTSTLATLAGAESLTNKKLGSLTSNGFVRTSGGDGTLSVDTTTYLSSAPGRLLSRSIVLNGTTTYTTPSGCTKILVQMIAAGGGGGGCTGANSQSAAGGGGGSGSYAEKVFTVTASTGYTVAVGAAGTGGSGASSATGNTGGNTTFTVSGTTVTCNGGLGGVGMASGTTVGTAALGGAGGAVSTNGDLNLAGQAGGFGLRMSGTLAVSGTGADGLFGQGGAAGLITAAAGNNAGNYGAGGGGAASFANTNRNGGDGSNGVIIVWEFSS